jgi:hypothetical protein
VGVKQGSSGAEARVEESRASMQGVENDLRRRLLRVLKVAERRVEMAEQRVEMEEED